MISVVIPALNEEQSIADTIASAAAEAKEVIVVDGGSSDRTCASAEAAGARVLESEPCRAKQMNRGAEHAKGDVLIFLHADTLLPVEFGAALERSLCSKGVSAGAFTLAINAAGAKYRLIEAIVSFRSRMSSLPYGDQAIFVGSEVFAESGGFKNMPIMEDYEFMCRMRRAGRIAILPHRALTSARRWRKLGVFRTAVVNFSIVVGYHLGVDPARLARWYRGVPRRTLPAGYGPPKQG